MELCFVVVIWLAGVSCLMGQNAPPRSVFYGCNNTFVSVSVKVDPLGANKRLDPAALTLGKCAVSSTTALFGYLVFEYQYSDCGFNRMALGSLVKFFVDLVYNPNQLDMTRYSQPFSQPIVCIVNRTMDPLPSTSAVVVSASGKGNLSFGYRFMNDDFSQASDSKSFVLGAPINLELSVDIGSHMPLRLLVDECIVTPTSDITATPSYKLITNHGCFVDGKVAQSRFVAQDQITVIWLTFPAMKFVTISDEIYLTFSLVVWDPKDITELRKACSYMLDLNRWELLGSADNRVCACCDYSCSSRKKRGVNANESGGLAHTMVLGPFKVHSPSTEVRSSSVGNESTATETGFLLPPAVGALFLELAVLMLLCVGVVLYSRSKQKWKETDDKRCLVAAQQ